MTGLNKSQIDIKNISITDHTKSKTIKHDTPESKLLEYVDTIHFYESIFSPCITADLFLIDGGNFKERYNISGDEIFNIEFTGYGSDVPLKYDLRVSEISSIIPSPNLRSKNILIKLASREILVDSALAVSKSYAVGAKEIVTDLISGYLGSKKNILVEPTKDLPIIVIPYLSPFKAIDFLRQRLVSQNFKSSSFLFFENSDGYHLTTAEGIVERSKKETPQVFFQKEGVSRSITGGGATDMDSFHLFNNLTVQSPFNISDMFRNGSLKTVVTQFDLTTKKYDKKVFGNSPSNKLFVDMTEGKNPAITEVLYKEYSSTENKPLFIPFAKYKDSENPTSNFLYDTLAERLCYSSLFTQQRLYADIPGNTRIKAGSVIEFKIPRYSSFDEKKEKNEVDSGMYLVTAVKHTITISDTSKYDTHIEMMRFGRGEFSE